MLARPASSPGLVHGAVGAGVLGAASGPRRCGGRRPPGLWMARSLGGPPTAASAPAGAPAPMAVGEPGPSSANSVKTARTSSGRGPPRGGGGPRAAGMGLERYTVVRKIGEGTYGAAYLVHLRDDPGHALVMYAPRPAPRPRGRRGGARGRLSNTNSLGRLRRLLSQGGGVDHVDTGGRSWPAAPPPALPPVVDVPPRRREVTSLGPVLVRSCVLLDPGDTTLRGTAAGPGHRQRGHRRAGSPDRALASEEAGCPGG